MCRVCICILCICILTAVSSYDEYFISHYERAHNVLMVVFRQVEQNHVSRSVSTRSHNLPGHRCRCNTSLSASLANLLLTELAKTSWHGYTVCANISTECYVSFQGLTEWLTPHMKTLRTGSLARNTFTFCCTKCFFLVLVLGARITIGLEEGPELPRAAMTTHRLSSLVHRGDTSSWWLKLKQLTLASPSLPGSLTPTKGRAPVVLDRSGATI